MGIKRSIFLFSLLFLIASACFSSYNHFSPPGSATQEERELSLHLPSNTSSEIERVENFSAGQVWHSTINKKLPLQSNAGFNFSWSIYSTDRSLLWESSLFAVKTYLLHIYPSHNFW